MLFSIHQFSSGIINPTKNQKDEWVSGGFGGEIANDSFPVPEEIRKAVQTKQYSGWRGFGIPDGYPPKPGEIALIARDLGRYCVLAVANIQKDEGDRPFIAYRYFWLDKTQFQNHATPQKVDGIGTLLWGWQEKGQPQYDIGELQTNRSSYTTSWANLQQVYLFQHWQPQQFQRIQSLLSDIHPSHQPLIYEATKIGGQLTYQEVHCLAIQYCTVNPGDINWAWNVRRLENPRDLNVIYCADADAFQLFNSKFPSSSPTQTPAQAPLEEGFTRVNNHSNPNPPGTSSSPRNYLLKFLGEFKPQDVLNLMNFYQEHQEEIGQFQDQIKINSFKNEDNPQDYLIKYATLLTALAPNQTQDILPKLMSLNDRQKRVAIKFLRDLKKMAKNDNFCLNHQHFLKFSYALTALQDELYDSLEQKGSNFSPSNILKQITQSKPPFLAWIFFFLLLGGLAGSAGLIYLQRSNILSMFSWVSHTISTKNKETNHSPPDKNAGNPQTKLVPLLNMYENTFNAVTFNAVQIKKYQIEQPESFQIISTAIQKSTEEIRQILNGNQQLLTDLKSQDSQVIQNARKPEKYPIYNDMKEFTTLNSAKIEDLPDLYLGNNGNDAFSVTMLQEALKRGSNYYVTGQDDQQGIFGEATKNAVIQAQTKANFSANEKVGRVGPKTWREILKDRIQDIQLEAVYQTLQTHLSQPNPTTLNIVTEIKKCQNKHNKEKKPLHFNDCLEKIGKSTNQSAQGANSGSQNPQNTQVR